MSWAQLFSLSFLQGLTEFLPISSSAHGILLPWIVGWSDQGIAFDIATHLGTLIAVFIYFRRDITRLLVAGWQAVFAGRRDDDVRFAWGLVVASVPVLALGALIGLTVGEGVLRLAWLIATASIVFGLALGYVDLRCETARSIASLRMRDYWLIGLAQAVALIPGSSRSGMAMLGARALGLDRVASARVSFLMAVPVIAAAVAFETVKVIAQPEPVAWLHLALGALISGIVAIATIGLFMRFVQSVGMMPFVIYRVLLGILIFVLIAVQA